VKALARALLIVVAVAMVGYMAWGRVEAYRLERDIKAIAARGEPIDLSSLDAPPPTPAHEEAARLYADAAARAREMAQQDARLTRLDVDAVVGRIEVGEIESTFRKDAPALQLLDRATTLPFAGFGEIDAPDERGNTAGLQALAALSALRGDLLAYHGDGDAAVQSLIASIRVQRTSPEIFPGYIIGARQFGSLRVLLRHASPSEASLEALQRAFAELPDEDGLVRDLMLRRARMIELRLDGAVPGGLTKLATFVLHPFLLRSLRVRVEQFPDVIAAAREPWPDKFATLTTLASGTEVRPTRRSWRDIIGGGPFNVALLAMPAQAGLNLAIRRLAVATLATERYRRAHGGAPPPNLTALVPLWLPRVPVDPFSGKPLVYRAMADGYLLYSVDINRLDDGGKLYGHGSLNPMPLPRVRDFGIDVPLTPKPGPQ
jgi:hypothetical protein